MTGEDILHSLGTCVRPRPVSWESFNGVLRHQSRKYLIKLKSYIQSNILRYFSHVLVTNYGSKTSSTPLGPIGHPPVTYDSVLMSQGSSLTK